MASVHDSRTRILPGAIVKALNLLGDCISILDDCGGTGRIAQYLVRIGHNVKVVDLSEDMLQFARRRGLTAEVQDARQLAEDSGAYGAVICLGNSLGGIPSKADRIQAIREMVRVSRKRVVIDCTNRIADWIVTWLPLHVRKLLGCYRAGLSLRQDIVTGTNLGDIVLHDRELDAVLYHYVYSAWELRREMKQAGLRVKFANSPLDRRVVLIGDKK